MNELTAIGDRLRTQDNRITQTTSKAVETFVLPMSPNVKLCRPADSEGGAQEGQSK